MPELIGTSPTERSKTRQYFDQFGRAISYVTLPLGILTAGTSLIAGSLAWVAIGGGSAFLDYTQIRERNKSSKEQSWYNPEKLWDKVWGKKGSARFNSSSTRMAFASS